MTDTVMRQILDKHIQDLQQREGMRRLQLDIDEGGKQWLLRMGISSDYGARLLARVIQKELLVPISQRLLDGSIRENENIFVTVNDNRSGLAVRPGRRPQR